MMEKDPKEFPRLRPVEAFPGQMDGKKVVCLRDPSEIAENVLALSMPLVEVVSMFDGLHSFEQIRSEFKRTRGSDLPADKLEGIVKMLDEGLFLEGPRLAAALEKVAGDFKAGAARPAFHAGKAYAADPTTLRKQLSSFFTSAEGPGAKPSEDRAPIRAVIAPHIDFQRGGPAYAWAYYGLPERTDADTFVIFGTCHAGLQGRFAATTKPYDTPLGPVEVDSAFLRELADRSKLDLFKGELGHRAEHSIEFQAVWLKYLFEGKRPICIVPVLTSFCHELAAVGRDPGQEPEVDRFFDALKETAAARDRPVCFVAGADLAHVGPRFGDPAPVSPKQLVAVEKEDRRMLKHAEKGDASAFFESISTEKDKRRICGYSPIYSLLRALGGGKGKLLRYAQWPDPEGTVTFASMTFS